MTPHKRSSALNGKTPQIKFAQDDAIRVTFLFDDVKQSIHEQYGASYNYTVSSQHTDGTVNDRAFMRCTEILHNRIIDAGAGKGAVIDIMKIQLPENKSGWDVALVTPCSSPGLALKDWDGNLLESLGSGKDMFSPGGTTPPPKPNHFPSAAAGKPVNALTLNDGADLIETCIYMSEGIWQRVCAMGDRDYGSVGADVIQSTAATIAIWADRKNLTADDKREVKDAAREEDDIPFS